ncbi:medium chain dehydrogenase/reductase family protein [Novosphingobium sp.]|uniref:medium chain dehydrogenase/reductase family protein n=1 Tax=Novosphingobium sp. TaxID=1874826 RepID=UPI00262F0A1F|nr:medium chain dehydrogenase/reductase family protein [Novosphingobium sp.]
MAWEHIEIARFGGPEVLELAREDALPEPGPGEVRIKVLAAGTGFTDTFIRMGRYPDFKGPLPFTPGYDLVGVVDAAGVGVTSPALGTLVADLSVVGGYAQYALRPAASLVPVPEGIDPAEAVCLPLAYMTAYQMLARAAAIQAGATVLVIGASGSVGTALLDLARVMKLRAIGTCSAANMGVVESYGAQAIDYRAGDFVEAVKRATGGRGVDAVFDAIGGAHFKRSFRTLAKGGVLVGYGSQTMATGGESLLAAGLGLARLKLWTLFSPLLGGRRAVWYSITSRRKAYPEQFAEDLAKLLGCLKEGRIRPIVADRLPLSAAADVHRRIDKGGLGGKVVLLPF